MRRALERAGDAAFAACLVAILVLPPLALGSVSPWARAALLLASVALAASWVVRGMLSGSLALLRTRAWWLALILIAAGCLQLLPLGPAALQLVSPAAHELRASAGPELGGRPPVSLDPYATRLELLRLATLALVFLVASSLTRRRERQLAALALVAAGTFQVLYGAAVFWSGAPRIFWLTRVTHLEAVTGTFPNKNHFAGLVEMALFAGLGLTAGLATAPSASPRRGPCAALAAACALCLGGVMLSLSRSSILLTLPTIVVFILMAARAASLRRRTLAGLALALLALAGGAVLGLDRVSAALEDAASGEATTFADRVDLWRSAVGYVEDFALTGSGLGSFASVFPRYQSARFGDRLADYLHNDWLQLACEAGLPLALALAAGAGFLLATGARRCLRLADPSERWLGLGALAGVAVMLGHSLTDYNLSKIGSNAVAFVTLVGLGLSAGASEREHWRLDLRRARARLAAGVLLVILAGLAAWRALPLARADRAFNEYSALVAIPQAYYFWPALPGARPARDWLEMAGRLEPDNPQYLAQRGRDAAREAQELLAQATRAEAERRYGAEAAQLDARVLDELAAQLWPDQAPRLERARALLEAAIAAAPAEPSSHRDLAFLELALDAGSARGPRRAALAQSLAPGKPAYLFALGRVLLEAGARAPRAPGAVPALSPLAQALLREAVAGDADYAADAFALTLALSGDPRALFAVTPATTLGLERLCRELWMLGRAELALECLDRLEPVAQAERAAEPGERPQAAIEEAEPGKPVLSEGAVEPSAPRSRRGPAAVLVEAARLRALSELRLGHAARALAAARVYHERRRAGLEQELAAARELAARGRGLASLESARATARRHAGDRAAWLGWVRAALEPCAAPHLEPGESAARLLSVVIAEDEPALAPAEGDEQLLARLEEAVAAGPSASERALAGLVGSAGAARRGELQRARELAREALEESEGDLAAWPWRHELWGVVGRCAEQLGDPGEAATAHRQALATAPQHRPSLERLIRLGAATAEEHARLEALTPQAASGLGFERRARLLGWSLAAAERGRGDLQELRVYWQIGAPLPPGCRPVAEIHDASGRKLRAEPLPQPAPARDHRSALAGEALRVRYRVPAPLPPGAFLRFGLMTPQAGSEPARWLLDELGRPFSDLGLEPDEPVNATAQAATE